MGTADHVHLGVDSKTSAAPVLFSGQRWPGKALLYAWLAAGTLDILAAFATAAPKGIAPLSILKAIASGVLGTKAFRSGGSGLDIAILGLLLHFAIMLGVAAVFWFASRRLRFLLAKPVAWGLLYGIAVYAFMNLVVLPLSAIAFKPSYSWSSLTVGIVVHMLCVGLPIALILSKCDANR